MSKRVLIAVDGSAGANRALDHAVQEAKSRGADLLIVNVIGGSGILEDVFLYATEGQQVWLKEMLNSLSAKILTEARKRAIGLGIATVHIESRSGDIAKTIIEIAKQNDAEMIVVGKRGIGRAAGLLLGSVSQNLISLADRPVLVVP